MTNEEMKSETAAPTVIANDEVGTLFKIWWEQACQSSLLLANENRALRARNAMLTEELDRLTARVESLVAQAKDAD